MMRWLRSASSCGLRPSSPAAIRIGVPCSSEPDTISTSWPAIRMYRLKTSEGTPKPATWPMWRGPLAYGQATADRTCVMSGSLGRAAGVSDVAAREGGDPRVDVRLDRGRTLGPEGTAAVVVRQVRLHERQAALGDGRVERGSGLPHCR